MFQSITNEMKSRMNELETEDAKDRIDGTPRLARLRQIPPETGKFIALMASMAPSGQFIEIGTSAGYSTMWLSLAAKMKNRKVQTFEVMPEKILLAKDTFKKANIENLIDLHTEDLRLQPEILRDIAFCFLDCEKELYQEFYDLIIPNLVKGGLLIAAQLY